jgi:hypothetical protein
MKTASEFFETHRDLHEQFKAEKIGVRKFERAIASMWDEIRAAGLEREVGDLIIADIRSAMAETRTMLATEGITWRDADGREKTLRVRGQAWEVTTR